MLEQRLNTPFQQAWMAKLMGFEFEIHYKEGKENKAADALSRMEGAELMTLVLNKVTNDLLEQIQLSWTQDDAIQKLIGDVSAHPQSHSKYSWKDNLLRRNGKLVVGNVPAVKSAILHWLHDSATGGHSGRDNTLARVKSLFYWRGMTKDIHTYV